MPGAALVPHGRGGLVLACRLLPRSVREDVLALYAVFRVLDDLVDDDAPDAAARVAAVRAWARGARPDTPEVATLCRLAARWELPRRALAEFCAGMEHDLAGARVGDEDDLDRYCFRVAGTVALTVSAVLGTRRPCAAEAATLGVALQRTNVLRDLDEDLAAGRCYVPAATLRRVGGGVGPGERGPLVRVWVGIAEARYRVGLRGIRALRRGRPAVAAAGTSYRALLREIARLEAPEGRVVVPPGRRALVSAAGVARWAV